MQFFADSKSRAQDLSNDVSFVIFGHQTWDLEGGVKLTPPPSISWFSSTPAGIGLTCTKKCKINKLAFIAQNNSKVSYLFLPVIFLSNYQTTSLETQHCPGYQYFLPFTRLIGLFSSTFPWFSQVS